MGNATSPPKRSQKLIHPPTPKQVSIVNAPDGTTKCFSESIAALIEDARRNPARPIIDKLLYVGDRLMLHGYEETFKSQFVFEMADAATAGRSFLGELPVPHPIRVGIIETEMKNPGLGERLAKMYDNRTPPENFRFLSRSALKKFLRGNVLERERILKGFVEEERPDIVIIDVVSDFFRGPRDPNKETHVAHFFDQLELLPHVKAWVLTRHDSKPKEDQGGDSNMRIRGSSEWKESPDTILHLLREDKTKERVKVSVGKLRYGRKPVPFWLRWDRISSRLVPDNPIRFLLRSTPLSREQVIEECDKRYGVGQRTVDKWIAKEKPSIDERLEGHKKIYAINSSSSEPLIWKYQENED